MMNENKNIKHAFYFKRNWKQTLNGSIKKFIQPISERFYELQTFSFSVKQLPDKLVFSSVRTELYKSQGYRQRKPLIYLIR